MWLFILKLVATEDSSWKVLFKMPAPLVFLLYASLFCLLFLPFLPLIGRLHVINTIYLLTRCRGHFPTSKGYFFWVFINDLYSKTWNVIPCKPDSVFYLPLFLSIMIYMKHKIISYIFWVTSRNFTNQINTFYLFSGTTVIKASLWFLYKMH